METNILFPTDSNLTQEEGLDNPRPFSLFNSETRRLRPLGIIVAVGRGNAIGHNGDLPWHIGADLRHFKELTLGHPVIMGRKTWESLPRRPLPGRRNIVVSRNPDYHPDGAERASSLEEAIAACDPSPLPFIIGGGEIYRQALPLATQLNLTRIDADCPDADTFFPQINADEWETVESSQPMTTNDGIQFRFETLMRR